MLKIYFWTTYILYLFLKKENSIFFVKTFFPNRYLLYERVFPCWMCLLPWEINGFLMISIECYRIVCIRTRVRLKIRFVFNHTLWSSIHKMCFSFALRWSAIYICSRFRRTGLNARLQSQLNGWRWIGFFQQFLLCKIKQNIPYLLRWHIK